MFRRIRFNISAAGSGQVGDTGIAYGEIRGIRWAPTTATDSGATLQLTLCNSDGDTAGGFSIMNDEDIGAAAFYKAPVIPQMHPDGFDTGGNDAIPVAAGERLRLKVIGAGQTLAGALYVYLRDDVS